MSLQEVYLVRKHRYIEWIVTIKKKKRHKFKEKHLWQRKKLLQQGRKLFWKTIKQLQKKGFGVIILKCLNVNSSTTSVGKRTNAQGGELRWGSNLACVHSVSETSAGTVCSAPVGKSSREMLFSARHLFNLTFDKNWMICLHRVDQCQYYSA